MQLATLFIAIEGGEKTEQNGNGTGEEEEENGEREEEEEREGEEGKIKRTVREGRGRTR